jgi:hypothetical protein
VFGDVDNDGDADLFVGKWAEDNQFFVNQGDSTFRDATAEAEWAAGAANAATLSTSTATLVDLLVATTCDSLPDPNTGVAR